ncbi:hypothetical protein ABZ485_01550 [Streptomyces albogriseolus]|uniref:hypothetical protein n=1 Tax=Streptomyces albogriseolus TaxID=1887 RepID=UPI003460BCEF
MRRAASVAAEEVYQAVVGPPVGCGVAEGFGSVAWVGFVVAAVVGAGSGVAALVGCCGAGETDGWTVGTRVPVPGGGGMRGPGDVAVVRVAPGCVDGPAGSGPADRSGASGAADRAGVLGPSGAPVPVPVPPVAAGGGGTSPGARPDGATPDVPATRGGPVLAPPSGTAAPVPAPWSGTPGGCVRPCPGGEGRVAGPPLGSAAPPGRDAVGTGAPVPPGGVGPGGDVPVVGVGSGPSVGSVSSFEADGLGLGVPSSCATHAHTPTPPRTSTAAPPAIHGARRGGRR